MDLRVRTLNARSRFAQAMLEASSQKVRGQIGVLERMVTEEVEREFVSRGGNLNRPDSGSRGTRLAGSWTTSVEFTRTFPIVIHLSSDSPQAHILNAPRGDYEIRPRAASKLSIPAHRSPTGRTMVRSSVNWYPTKRFNAYARIGMERAVRAFLARF